MIIRHLSGRTTGAEVGAAFFLAALWIGGGGGALWALFELAGWEAWEPREPIARVVSALWLGVSALVSVWFAIGAVTGFAQPGAKDNRAVMALVALVAAGWAGRAGFLIAAGSAVAPAIGGVAVHDWRDVSVSGEIVYVRGTLRTPVYDAVLDAVLDNPQARVLQIESGGGSAVTGDLLARIVQANDMDVHVRAYCASACIPIFLAGERRILGPGARLGCHQTSNAITGESLGPARNFRDRDPPDAGRETWREVIAQCDATPPRDIYTPPLRDLIEIGAVTHIGRDHRAVETVQDYCRRRPQACL